MGKPPRGHAVASSSGKRPRQETANAQSASKKLLSNNRYAILENGDEPEIKKKEKLPRFFVKGFPPGLQENIKFYIEQGLKCTMRMCTEGIMLMVPARKYYNAIEELLKREKWEYFSHDIEEDKPLKVVVRGLPDMEIAVLSMNWHDASRKYRDQLYLVHLERNTTCLKDVQFIRALFQIVVTLPTSPRNVTQCSSCLMFGNGTKNCHKAYRCNECSK
ncbi:uncharacterized protein LOC135697365 [Ochlerotatus camptorhynchus]|uniref:uncharacterized protein LOC135697365 n=1 Tax=Ochlerotatus camptorhynchus TaxID=644619 RepID=UPI0031D6AD88